jgi:hypothetical protein
LLWSAGHVAGFDCDRPRALIQRTVRLNNCKD